jgi:hypothetical protein
MTVKHSLLMRKWAALSIHFGSIEDVAAGGGCSQNEMLETFPAATVAQSSPT